MMEKEWDTPNRSDAINVSVETSTISITLSLKLPDQRMLAESIMPDLASKGSRVSIDFEEKDGKFHIYIRAADDVALRAALGTVSRQLMTALKVSKGVK
ncbi:MAG: CTAG/PCC1 family protein [Candidatus Thermoplasmatota archaeon]|nr:CTAG/PCC1 family protein [Candidatus Thermoplasmatota archaeon]